MPPIVKILLPILIVVVVVVIGFQVHWLLGSGLVIALLAYAVVANRSILYAQRGNMAYMKGDEAKALELLEKAYQTGKAHPQFMVGYAYILIKKNELSKAESILREMLDKPLPEPLRIQAKVNLATVLWLDGRQDEGYELLTELYPEYKTTQVYGNLGYFKLLRNEDLEQTLQFNLEAYDYNDDDLTIIDNLAQNYYFLGRYEEAREMYEKVMAKSPKSADSYYYYALTLRELGQLDEAREQIKLAQDRDLALVTSLSKEQIASLADELGVTELSS